MLLDDQIDHSVESVPSVLVCPQCERAPREILRHDTHNAILRCGCRDIPLAEGVFVPDRGALQDALLEALRDGDQPRVRRLVLDNHARKARLLEAFGVQPRFEHFVRHRTLSAAINRFHLRPVLEALPPKRITHTIVAAAQWNDYVRHRFSQPPMLSIIPILGLLLQGREGYVMDSPCGMGHLAFMMSKLVPGDRIVCMDLSPPFAYSARRFFVPNLAAAIAHDMNLRLPLAGGQFGLIVCSDAFHYVQDRELLAKEFMRLLRDDGVVVLAHVHNRLQQNRYAGYPLSPAEYARLFEGYHVRIFPESYLLDAYLENRPLDLSRPFEEDQLNASRVLHVVAAKSPEAFAVVPNARDALLDASRNPRLSGLYRMRRQNGNVIFERNIPECLQDDFEGPREILPPSVTVPASEVTQRGDQLRFHNPRPLLEKHVLVDVPVDY